MKEIVICEECGLPTVLCSLISLASSYEGQGDKQKKNEAYTRNRKDVEKVLRLIKGEERKRTLEEVGRTDKSNYDMKLGLLQILNDFHRYHSYNHFANPDVAELLSKLSNLINKGNE